MEKAQARINHSSKIDAAKILEAMPKDAKEVVVKTIIGAADGISKRRAPDGDRICYGLMGKFVSVIPGGETEASGIMFLPEGTIEPFLKPFQGDKPPEGMDIVLEVSLVRADNENGYNWKVKPLLAERNDADAIASIRKKLAERKIVLAGDTEAGKPAKK